MLCSPQLHTSIVGTIGEFSPGAVVARKRLPEVVRLSGIGGLGQLGAFPGGMCKISVQKARNDLFADCRFDRRIPDLKFFSLGMLGGENNAIGGDFGFKDRAGGTRLVRHSVPGPFKLWRVHAR